MTEDNEIDYEEMKNITGSRTAFLLMVFLIECEFLKKFFSNVQLGTVEEHSVAQLEIPEAAITLLKAHSASEAFVYAVGASGRAEHELVQPYYEDAKSVFTSTARQLESLFKLLDEK